MLYQSVDNKKIKDIKKLHTHKYREKTHTFLVEGEHLVLEAYKKGFLKELILEQDTLFPLDVETMYVTNNVLSYISELETPQTVMGICEMIPEKEVLGNHILMLDGVQDPGNMGTIIRSAVAFGVDTIVMSPDCVDIYNSKVVRASQGLLFHMQFITCDLLGMIEHLKEQNYPIYATRVTHGSDVRNIKDTTQYVLIMGNEGNGVREEVMDNATNFLYIPMDAACESLNVGVATSILLFALKGSENHE
ncbi:MAG: RNA methyltransferase [Firmicutes bacterium]|nr:RNA methyltransferase [Bacillota bacterium]